MPSLRYKAHDGCFVYCTFSTRTSATAAEFARISQLSSFRPGQAVWPVREFDIGPPITTQISPAWVDLLQPCWVISLAFGTHWLQYSQTDRGGGEGGAWGWSNSNDSKNLGFSAYSCSIVRGHYLSTTSVIFLFVWHRFFSACRVSL